MRFFCFFFAFLGVFPLSGNAQIQINVQQEPLASVLQTLNQEYDLQYSCSYDIASDCRLSLAANFEDLDEALDKILSACDLQSRFHSGVYIIERRVPKTFVVADCVFEGRLIDAEDGTALSNVVIQYNEGRVLSDEGGYFRIKMNVKEDPFYFSHIAYKNIDTVLNNAQPHTLRLQPTEVNLEEVVIEDFFTKNRSQQEIEILRAFKAGELQAGLYLSLEEMIENQPSMPWISDTNPKLSYRIRKIPFDFSVYLRMPYEQIQEIDKLVGFCDGTNLYLNLWPKNRYQRFSEFVQLYPVGPYCYYEDLEYDIALEIWSLERYVFDLVSGEKQTLTKRMIRDLIAEDSELSTEFKKDWKKYDNLDEYLFLFFDTPHLSESE